MGKLVNNIELLKLEWRENLLLHREYLSFLLFFFDMIDMRFPSLVRVKIHS